MSDWFQGAFEAPTRATLFHKRWTTIVPQVGALNCLRSGQTQNQFIDVQSTWDLFHTDVNNNSVWLWYRVRKYIYALTPAYSEEDARLSTNDVTKYRYKKTSDADEK